MPAQTPHSLGPHQVLSVFWQRRRWIVTSTLAGGAIGLLVAIMKPRMWEASQALHVRQEVAHRTDVRPGSFASLSEMKTLQETILEVAKSQRVIRATLKATAGQNGETVVEPTPLEIEEFRQRLAITPPGGAEFGMTEVFYLKVRAEQPELATRLVYNLCGQLITRLRELRDIRARSMISELEETVTIAEADLNQATMELMQFESEVGADLAELRMLESATSGTSDIRQNIVAMETAKRPHETLKLQNEQLLELLEAAKSDPRALIATPNSLLASQPSLRILKDGLVRAKLKSARLQGLRSDAHPLVIAAVEAEREVLGQLREELPVAIQGVQLDLHLATDRLVDLDAQIAIDRGSLERLATLRAKYANLDALAKDRTQLLETARERLADARASQASARGASLISRIDGPESGVNPAGPSRAVIAAVGFVGGGLVGMGLVFLLGLPSPYPADATFASLPEPVDSPAVNASAAAADVPTPAAVNAAVAAPSPATQNTPPQRREPTPETAAQIVSGPVPRPKQTLRMVKDAKDASDSEFGMFRGMTLRQAMQVTRMQDAQNPPTTDA